MNNLPRVVIVGRTNVGKSTLFNRLSEKVKSITLDAAGVTRDVIKDVVVWHERSFELADTGGINLRKTDDPIFEAVRLKALAMIESADLILFVLDGKVGVVQEDQELMKMLRKLAKPVVVVINKIDISEVQQRLHEFSSLGFKHIMGISAQHGTGIGDLLDLVASLLPYHAAHAQEAVPVFRVVLLGKPNVGKSSLLNVLLKEERAIVAPQAGTTREAISEKVRFYQHDIQLTDTPGVRRKRKVEETLEGLMVKSSFRAVEDADIVLLLIDVSAGSISDQELKLAFYAFEHEYKAVIVIFNKLDLVDEEARKQIEVELKPYDHFFKRIERLDISCTTEKNVGRLLPKIQKVWERYSTKLSGDELTFLFKDALRHRQLFHNGMPLKVKAAWQVETAPMTIYLSVNEPEWFGPSQLKFLENTLRKKHDLKGVPVKFLVRKNAD